eukprot:jgi/Chlat1/3295/Chrsp22S03539
MAGGAVWLAVWLAVTAAALPSVAESSSSSECEALGFTGLAVCSDCDLLAQYVQDEELEADCRRCCSQESGVERNQNTYKLAVLEVCGWKLGQYPHVQEFIDKKASSFKNLKVRYRPGSSPKLLLGNDFGKKSEESIRIDHWKTEHIVEFLIQKLENNAGL